MTIKICSTKIYETEQYDIFKFIHGNREIDKERVEKYFNMIKEGYPQYECPILVTKNYEILDGQHRYEAAQLAKTPVYFIISEKASDSNAMIDINKNQNNWESLDYINCFAARGNENYKKLSEFITNNRLSVSIALVSLGYKRFKLKEKIIEGNFVFSNEKAKIAELWLEKYKSFLSRLIISGEKSTISMCSSYCFLEAIISSPNKHEDFFEVLFAHRMILKRCGGWKGYFNQFKALSIADE